MPLLRTAAPAPAKKTDTLGQLPVTDPSFDHRKELLERILNHPLLPTPPMLALQIVDRTRQPDCKIEEVGEMLAQDPALCARLLKTLNSSLYGLSRPVSSISRAVTMLGLKPLRSLILGLTMSTMHMSMEPDEGLRRHWRNSVAGAIITREFSRQLKYLSPEEDMVASLLRDLGMLLLRQAFPSLYEPVWSQDSKISHVRQCGWEEKHLGVHHADVSATLLERWRLPPEIVEPIRYHHFPGEIPVSGTKSGTFSGRTYLLDFTSRLAELDDMPYDEKVVQQILQTAAERFGLDRGGLELFLAEVTPRIEEFAAVLSVDIGTCPDFADILVASSDELIQSSVEGARRAQTDSDFLNDQLATHSDKPSASGKVTSVQWEVEETDSCEDFFAKLTKSGENKRMGQYEIIDMIGKGGMGLVIKAHDVALDRYVALKFLVPSLVRSRKAHERFALEARFAAAIRHENVVSIYAVSELGGLPFLVMEYIEGRSLQDYLDTGAEFKVAEIARMAKETALGLAAAHDLRLIHRDIKPANLILGEPGKRVRITDFGLARAMDHDYQISQQGSLIGTPVFMSPEQVDGKPLTPASDLFSLGSVLYTLCTGQHPFAGESFTGLLNAVAMKKARPIRELNPNIPEWLTEMIDGLHAKDPETRLGPASAVAAYVDKHIQ
jgi:HD-like signal output (HDOD) protein